MHTLAHVIILLTLSSAFTPGLGATFALLSTVNEIHPICIESNQNALTKYKYIHMNACWWLESIFGVRSIAAINSCALASLLQITLLPSPSVTNVHIPLPPSSHHDCPDHMSITAAPVHSTMATALRPSTK